MTTFTNIYKNELKSKGILRSLGSTVMERTRERLDARNMLFGGSGILAATGQKIFGRGYNAIQSGPGSKLATKTAEVSGLQSEAVSSLLASSLKQESQLAIIAKNTMNNNAMARDMNVMRQNMMKLVTMSGGKASRGADMFFKSAKARENEYESKFKKDTPTTTPTNATKSPSSFIGSMVSGILGGIGSGLLGGFRAVMAVAPIIGLIGIAGAAYVVKELSKLFNVEEIKNKIYDAIGYDPASSKTFIQQMTDKLDDIFKTTKFNDSLTWVMDKFGPTFDMLGESIAKITDITTVYIQAAYKTLADSVANSGKVIGFLFNEFFESNKGKIYAALTAGLAIGVGGKSAASALVGLGAVGLAGLFGAATGTPSRDELKTIIPEKEKEIVDFQKEKSISLQDALTQRAKGGLFVQNLSSNQKQLLQMYDELQRLKNISESKNKEFEELTNPKLGSKFQEYLKEGKKNLPGGEYGGGYKPMSSTAPSPASYAERIAANESAGKYDTVFGKEFGAPGAAKINGKLVTENTIDEVSAWQKSMSGTNRQAAGKYQFMNVAAAARLAGLSANDLFNGPNQERMMQAYTDANAKRLSDLGLPTTPEYLSMAHAVGPDGAKSLIDAQKAGQGSKNSLEILGLKGAAAQTNPQLDTSVNATIARLKAIPSSSGKALTTANANSADLNRALSTQSPQVIVNTPQTYNNVAGGKGTTPQVASATNIDALELFFKFAM